MTRDFDAIPRLPGVSFSGLELYFSIYISCGLPDDKQHPFNRALRDLWEEISTMADRFGVGQQREYWGVRSSDVPIDYCLQQKYYIPHGDPEMSVAWLYVILEYLSAARRALEWHNKSRRRFDDEPIDWTLRVGGKQVPWDESARCFGLPV
jgi:hypothetical protein